MAAVIPWVIMPMYVHLYFGGRTQRSNCESKFGAETKVTCDRVKEECLEPTRQDQKWQLWLVKDQIELRKGLVPSQCKTQSGKLSLVKSLLYKNML